MDKKLLAQLRKIHSLSKEELPDSITPEALGNLIEKQTKDSVKAEDFKKLQQKLSEKDIEIKKALEEKAKLEDKGKDEKDVLIKELSEKVEEMSGAMKTLNEESETKKLKTKYPDIATRILLGRDEEEQERIVEEQRAINAKTYEDSPSIHSPVFSNLSEIDEEIERVKGDQTIDTDQKLLKVSELKEQRAEM